VEQQFGATTGLYWFQHYTGQWAKWRDSSERCLSLARESGNPTLILTGLFIGSHGAFWCGDLPSSIARGEELIDRLGAEEHWTPMLGGQDLGATALLTLGNTLVRAGYPVQGLERIREAIRRTREADDPNTLPVALCHGALSQIEIGDFAAGRIWAEESIQATARLGGARPMRGWPLTARGLCDVMLGRVDKGLEDLDQVAKGTLVLTAAWVRGWHAVALNVAGRGDEGRQAFEGALANEDCNAPPSRSPSRRLYGDLLANLPEPDYTGAEAAYRKAIEIARGFHARTDELNATVGLARLLRSQGRIAEAREMLAEIYSWFSEGHEFPFLVEAGRLLEELGRANLQ